ncbi:hypothetical protein NIES4071_107890 (plasmid) [Calothrix sp. NIES-4071]|nr:hypothetical protein NIES4071_107890 [Calothrix sp. NIES-4071]BAZ64829.1 hypothetical protein NIES4105_105620 [Calothrix sp. NIES-4105]
MITQFQGFDITSLDELTISPSQFNDFMIEADSCVHPIGALYTSTVRILRHASWLAEQKATLTKQEYKELLRKYNWEGEEKAHLKVHEAFGTFAPHQLAQIEPRTIFQIALNLKKYQSVIAQMLSLPIITQNKVRGFMKKCHKARATKETEEATIWRMMPDKKRACVIGPIYNQSVGVMLEEMMDKSGKSAQFIVEKALIAHYESEYATQEVEAVSCEAQSVDVVGSDEQAPIVGVVVDSEEVQSVDAVIDSETAPAYSEAALNSSAASWDKDLVAHEESLNETSEYNPWYDEELDVQEAWSFEPEEKDDVIEDYEFLTSEVSKTTAPVGFTSSTVSVSGTMVLSAVEELVQALQTATSWQEINEALKTHEEYKEEAWDALTPVERRRVIELTPPTVIRLSNAKRAGLITDFRVERECVYQIKQSGCLFWDIVFEWRIDEYFARL